MAQASAATFLDQPSSTSAIASMRRAAFASCVPAAASRSSLADRSERVIATVIVASIPWRPRITSLRAASTHDRVNGRAGWYKINLELFEQQRGNQREDRAVHSIKAPTKTIGPGDVPMGRRD